MTYESFANQIPDGKGKTRFTNTVLESVKIIENDKERKLKSKELYAVVEKGVPYVANEHGYFRLFKTNDDLCFVGKATVQAESSDVMVSTIIWSNRWYFGFTG